MVYGTKIFRLSMNLVWFVIAISVYEYWIQRRDFDKIFTTFMSLFFKLLRSMCMSKTKILEF